MIDDLIRSEVNKVTGSNASEKTRPTRKVRGYVAHPKKSAVRKMADVFLEEDLDTVRDGLIYDVAVPRIRDFVADVFIGFIERMLYGNSSRGANGYSGRSLTNSLVRSISPGSSVDYTRASRGVSVVENTPRFTLNDVVMRDRAAAQDLLDELRSIIKRYGNVSVAELYDILDCTNEAGSDYNDNKWGWTNLDGVRIFRVTSGYRVALPKPIALK